MTSGASMEELLFELSRFLRDQVRPAISDPALAYRVRVAAHVAHTMAREVTQAPAADRRAVARLEGLVGVPGTLGADDQRGLTEVLSARLAADIREDADLDWDAVTAHIRETLRDELAWTHPGFDLRKELP